MQQKLIYVYILLKENILTIIIVRILLIYNSYIKYKKILIQYLYIIVTLIIYIQIFSNL